MTDDETKPAPRSLVLGMPVYREIDFEAARTLVDFALDPPREGWRRGVALMRGQPVSVVREKIALEAVFGEAEADVLVYLDSDVSLDDPKGIWKLAERLLAFPEDVGLLGLAVPMQQQGPLQQNVHPIPDDGRLLVPVPVKPTQPGEVDTADPYLEAAAIGFGCVAIRREVFLALERPWFRFETDPEDENRFVGEDIGFCDRMRAAGFRVYVDLSLRASHWFRREHPGLAPHAPPVEGVNRREERA